MSILTLAIGGGAVMLGLRKYSWVYKAWQTRDGKWRDHATPGDVNTPIVDVQSPERGAAHSSSPAASDKQSSDESRPYHEDISEHIDLSEEEDREKFFDEIEGWGENENFHTARSALIGSEPPMKLEVTTSADGKINAVMSSDYSGKDSVLHHIAVRPDAQGKGLAKEFMTTLAKRSLKAGKDVTLTSTPERVGFYLALGAVREGEEKKSGVPMRWSKERMTGFLNKRERK